MPDEPTYRPSGRVILLDAERRTLLVRFVDPVERKEYWATIGGVLEPGESFAEAARREMIEETGLEAFVFGPCIWICRQRFRMLGSEVEAEEHFFVVTTETTAVAPSALSPIELESMVEFRWWSLRALEESPEVFYPEGLVTLLTPIVRGDVPAEPIQIGD